MALTITPTPDPYSYVVRLYVAGGTPPYTVTAQPSGGRPAYTVRSPQTPVTGDATARNMVDGQAPLGLDVSTVYRVTDSAGVTGADSTAASVPASNPVLSDALDPNKFLALVVVSQKPNRWAPRSVWFDVLGRRDPTVAIGPMRLRDGQLVLRLPASVNRRQMIDLLTPGDPMLLRTPCPSTVDDVTFLVTDLNEALVTDDPAGPTLFELTYQGVTGDLGPFTGDPSRTYATVLAAWSSYDQLPPAYATYGDLTSGTAYSGQGPQLLPNGWGTTTDYNTWSYGWSSGAPGSSVGGVGQIVSSGTSGSRWIAMRPSGSDLYNYVTVPGKRYRVSFQARQASGVTGAQAWVDIITNTAPALADYFQPGAVQLGQVASTVNLDGQWRTVSYDVTIPAGDDRMSVSFNVRNMPAGAATYEVRNPSVRELT